MSMSYILEKLAAHCTQRKRECKKGYLQTATINKSEGKTIPIIENAFKIDYKAHSCTE
jgi:hypothetical protein